MKLSELFNPKSIAIVGASAEEGKVGNVIAKNVLNLGYGGEIYLVNPKHSEILGKKCYPNLFEVDRPIDLAIIVIPAKFVLAEIEKNADRIKNFVIISAGFSETGLEGKEREETIKKIAEEKKLNILGPNCLGFIIPKLKLNASFAGGMPKEGNIAFISQSGALAVGIMDIAEKEDIRFSSIISIGNKMDIDEARVLDYLATDESTKVIGMYLEGIKNGAEFMKTAKEISAKKPVVILKAGKTEKSQMAISSHTGALAGSDEITSAVFKKCGIIRTENLEEFFNVLNLISQTEAPRSENVVIITNAGGPGVLATDAFSSKSIKMSEIQPKIRRKLREFLPEESSFGNPVDLLGDAHEDRYSKTLRLINKDENIGSIILVLTPQEQTPVSKITRKIISFKEKTDKNVSTVFIGKKRVEKSIKKLKGKNIPNFQYPDQAVFALDSYYNWNVKKGGKFLEKLIDAQRKSGVSEIINRAKAEGRKALYFEEASEIMKMYGIKTTDFWEYKKDLDLEKIKYPAAVKIDSDKILHKTDKKGLILDIKDKEELKFAVKEMQNNFNGEKIIIQPMFKRQTELILGIKKDAIFGPIVMYGLGGIYTEMLKTVDFAVPPLNMEEIKKSLMESKIKFLFSDTRGQKAYDVEELSKIILGISQFAFENEEFNEFDINPLLIYNNKSNAVAVDVKIII